MMKRKHELEQQAYNEIRHALQVDFINDPVQFVTNYKKRPEDMTGEELRALYPHFLITGRDLFSTDPVFIKHFMSGGLFGC
jgi:hypothetical protein